MPGASIPIHSDTLSPVNWVAPVIPMARLGLVMRRLGPGRKLSVDSADSHPPTAAEAPKVKLPHVDTQLNMHQYTGFFEDGSPAGNGLPVQPPNPSASPDPSNGDNTTEWSAVGHAATGKSGRVIHNLQEEVARRTRECSLYRSRADETQRLNETLKIQVQNMTERLQNLEQVNDTNLNSIARKDRKIEELRAELQSERTKRQGAEMTATQTNQTMRDEREQHNRDQARAQELVRFHETQYEVLSAATKREKADLGRRVKGIRNEVNSMAEAQKTQNTSTERLDVISDQKNREIENLKSIHDKLMAAHANYKQIKDDELRSTIERAQANTAMIDATLASLKETEAHMKWAIQLNSNRPES
ncbi:hypothetical protein NUU61_000225 [Penicillium alfredii]|uniref:SWI5-dependent HO expression protein 3 n=1 Tax=Penicillium alfredii TaxID=1506179 RepID=A0A9W9KQT6_9EURO|nr:uncharacterized protein NUU61_000225 [Penicillium alfredii]KAJ5114466.1 hypothetical protein NUU61_000225 [Penicillium alfredii]